MSSLADRLAEASLDRVSDPAADRDGPVRGAARSGPVDDHAQLRTRLQTAVLHDLGPQLRDATVTPTEQEQLVRSAVAEAMRAEDVLLTTSERARLTQDVVDDLLGHGPIEPYLRDPDLTEVLVNGPDSIYVERAGRLVKVDGRFTGEAQLRRTIDALVSRVGRRIDESCPIIDARLPDGSRINAVIPPVAVDGSLLRIRTHAPDLCTSADLVAFGTYSQRTAEFLAACVRGRLNVVVSGSSGSGTTTTLNVLASAIPGDERIVTIEDAVELQLHQDHVLRLAARPAGLDGGGTVSTCALLGNALQMRPDRVVVGEVHAACARDLLQALTSGLDGLLCTVRSTSPRDTVARLEAMARESGPELPVPATRDKLVSAVDVIVHQSRLRDGSRRITHVTEVNGVAGDAVAVRDIFRVDDDAGFDEDGRTLGRLRATGLRPAFLPRLDHAGVAVDPSLFDRDEQ